MALPFVKEPDTTPEDLLRNQISTTGENMAVRRFVRYELGDRPGLIEIYMHPGNRVGVMLEINSETAAGAAKEAFAVLAHDLALHIAASAPLCLTREQIPDEKLEAEKEIYRKQALEEGKPAAIVERIIQGRLKKFYESTVMLEQPFVKDDKLQISELLEQYVSALGEKVTIRRFARYELGEVLD
jgi:elongation factor Ts